MVGLAAKLGFLATAFLGLAAAWIRVEGQTGRRRKGGVAQEPAFLLGVGAACLGAGLLILTVVFRNMMHLAGTLTEVALPLLSATLLAATLTLLVQVIRRTSREARGRGWRI